MSHTTVSVNLNFAFPQKTYQTELEHNLFMASTRSAINPKERDNTPKLSFISAPSKTSAQFSNSAHAKEADREANRNKTPYFSSL